MSRASHTHKAIARRTDLGLDALAAGDLDAAIDHLRKAVALAPQQPRGHLNLAQALLLNGELADGFAQMQWMFPRTDGALIYDGRRLAGETVVVHHDATHGFGDDIMFARYAVTLRERGARVVVVVPPELNQLFKTLPDVATVFSSQRLRLPIRYYEIEFMSLPHACGTTLETIPAPVPYLSGDPEP
jgi:hypothetical protein